MEEQSRDVTGHKDDHRDLQMAAFEENRSSLIWMQGLTGCFSTVMSLFSRAELKTTKGKLL